MLKNLSIKAKLYIMAICSAFGLLILTLLLINSINNINKLGDAKVKIETLYSNVLTLRKIEKDFLSRKDLIYKQDFENIVNKLRINSKQFEKILTEFSITTSNLTAFNKIMNFQLQLQILLLLIKSWINTKKIFII